MHAAQLTEFHIYFEKRTEAMPCSRAYTEDEEQSLKLLQDGFGFIKLVGKVVAG